MPVWLWQSISPGVTCFPAASMTWTSAGTVPAGSVPSCGATLDYMLDVFPLLTVVKKVLTGGGECAQIDWTFLGLSMPAWVLISVLALVAWGLWVNLRPDHANSSSSTPA